MRLTQTFLWVSRTLWWRSGSVVGCCRVEGTEYISVCMGSFEGGHHYLHYFHHGLTSGQTTGREHSPALQQKIGLKFTDHGPAHKNKTQFPPQSLTSGSFHKPLILLHQRADRLKTTITENYPMWSHGPQPCLIQWNYEPCPCRATQDGWVMVESSDKTWSTGEGNDKPLQFSCLKNPRNSMKKQKDVG